MRKAGAVDGWAEVGCKTGYWHSLIVFFHKILINYREGNGDLTVKPDSHNFVQVIPVPTIGDGVVGHPRLLL